VTAYHVVSRQIQKQQDTALVANLKELADELRQAKQELFSIYLKASSILKGGETGTTAVSGEEADPTAAVGTLLEEAAAADAAAEAKRGTGDTEDKLFLDALNDMRRPPSEPEVAPELKVADPKAERMRLRLLAGTAVVMFALCASVWILMASGQATEPEVPTAELPAALAPSRAVIVGPMLYAQVNSWVWDEMTDPQREAHVSEIGESARERGCETVYLTDEKHRDLAQWTAGEGVSLAEAQP
jgi:hypothetical protein